MREISSNILAGEPAKCVQCSLFNLMPNGEEWDFAANALMGDIHNE